MGRPFSNALRDRTHGPFLVVKDVGFGTVSELAGSGAGPSTTPSATPLPLRRVAPLKTPRHS